MDGEERERVLKFCSYFSDLCYHAIYCSYSFCLPYLYKKYVIWMLVKEIFNN